MNHEILPAGENDYPELARVWESSVKATHDFLRPEDFEFFKEIVKSFEVFQSVELFKATSADGIINGFLGVANRNIEMLFIAAESRRNGLGKQFIQFAINELGATTVDVNRDNVQATGFYERFGFRVYKETETDAMGKPYPMLYMRLEPLE